MMKIFISLIIFGLIISTNAAEPAKSFEEALNNIAKEKKNNIPYSWHEEQVKNNLPDDCEEILRALRKHTDFRVWDICIHSRINKQIWDSSTSEFKPGKYDLLPYFTEQIKSGKLDTSKATMCTSDINAPYPATLYKDVVFGNKELVFNQRICQDNFVAEYVTRKLQNIDNIETLNNIIKFIKASNDLKFNTDLSNNITSLNNS